MIIPAKDIFTPARKISNDMGRISQIKGLTYLQNFLSEDEEKELIHSIDNENWLPDLKRRVQHYGYKYDYKRRSIDYSMYLGGLPVWSNSVCSRLKNNGWIKNPDQLIVNEYNSGQGIAAHVDCEPCFSETIISISALSPCVMIFRNKHNPWKKIEVLLEPRSIVVLKEDARYKWTHEIRANKFVVFNDEKLLPRSRRVSLTFREVVLEK